MDFITTFYNLLIIFRATIDKQNRKQKTQETATMKKDMYIYKLGY